MHLFNLRRRDEEISVAIQKQRGVFSLWQSQCVTFGVIERGLFASCISEEQAQEWKQEINRSRLALQDSFLLARDRPRVEADIERAKAMFAEISNQYRTTVCDTERSMTPEERVANISANFAGNFTRAYEAKRIDRGLLRHLQQQVEVHAQTFHDSVAHAEIRDNIKTRLAHDLIDDYYRDVMSIFNDIVAQRKGIKNDC